ncbi:hypothetical protein [Agrococcus versicolor]
MQTALAWVPMTCAAIAGLVVEVLTGAEGPWAISQLALAYVAVAFVGACLMHELAHVVVAAWGVTSPRFDVEIRLLRCSVRPLHPLSRGRVILGALAGPGLCITVGCALAIGSAPAIWVVPFVAHAVSLLPTFGDGRSICAALRDA